MTVLPIKGHRKPVRRSIWAKSSIQDQKLKDNIELSPEKMNINMDNYQKAVIPHSIIDNVTGGIK